MRHKRLLIVLSLVLAMPGYAWSQLAVYDALNHGKNTVTALQSTISAVEAVVHTGYWFMELEPWGDSPLAGSFGEDLVELEGILAETQAILFELKAIQDQFARVFSLDSAPDSTAGLQERMWEIRRIRAESYRRARDIQTLPGRITNVIGRMWGLADRIMQVLGAKQGGQQLQAMAQNMTLAQAQTQVIVASYQQAVLTDAAERPMVEQAWDLINEQLYADWPRR